MAKRIVKVHKRMTHVLLFGVVFGIISFVTYAFSSLPFGTAKNPSSGGVTIVHADHPGSDGDGSDGSDGACDGAGDGDGDCGCGY